MKAALIFLVFFVGASYQQAYYPYWPAVPQYYYYPHAPLAYSYSLPAAPMAQARLSADMEGKEGDEEVKITPTVTDAMARGNSLVFTLGGLFPSVTSTTTKTTWTTVSSTATTATVISCIPSTYFSASAACRRRRAIFEDSGLSPALLPSPKEAVAPSVAAEEVQREAEPEIQSSQDEISSDPLEKSRDKRLVTTVSTLTVTSTSTSYSFTVTTYTKTLSIGSTTSVLICLPSGLSVCGASG